MTSSPDEKKSLWKLTDDEIAPFTRSAHNSPEHHYFGEALLSPGDPEDIGITKSTGAGLAPAREDHVHAITGATVGSVLTPAILTAPLTFASLALRNASTPTVGEICSVHSNDNDEGIYEYTSAGTWRYPWNLPWGWITYGTQSTQNNSGTSGAYASVGLSITWTAVLGRVYKITVTAARVDVGAGDVQTASWHTGGGTFIEVGAVIVNSTAVGMGYPVFAQLIYQPAAGSTTVELKATSSSVNAGIWQSGGNRSVILVEDIGHNGAPT